jgi:hypothetical protein
LVELDHLLRQESQQVVDDVGFAEGQVMGNEGQQSSVASGQALLVEGAGLGSKLGAVMPLRIEID